MNGQCEQQNVKRGTPQLTAPPEPRRTGQQESEHVKRHALAEGLKPIEQELERCPFRCVRLFFGEPICDELRMLIKERLIVCAVGVTDDCVFSHDWMNLADPD